MLEHLKKGNSLENPELWKKIQSLINLIAGLAPLLIVLFPSTKEFLTPENFAAAATAISTMNIYFTAATSEKIGL